MWNVGALAPNNVVPLKDERFNAKNAAATSTLSLKVNDANATAVDGLSIGARELIVSIRF